MTERVLCAAIWYKDLDSFIKRKVDNSLYLPVNVNRGVVFCGHRHAHCLYQMVSLTGMFTSQVGESVQGFLTNTNRFVNRIEAKDIAEKANQIIDFHFLGGKELFSENLY